ncbi:MAG TPA: hypothetical protein VGY99_10685 [Candidatus Binataceae bacterium]|jgi:hypothetical protein|nr:hypothetical protein [Candidatus Binataceae bacterium]
MLTALIEIAALAIAFALGVMLSSSVKAVLGIAEEDVMVELGLLRADVGKIVHDFEDRLKRLEGKEEKIEMRKDK